MSKIRGVSPGEMSAFLTEASRLNIREIIESGRGRDASSTIMLADYARRTGARIVSIDMEQRLWNSIFSRWKMLGRRRFVHWIVGDATHEIPKLLPRITGPSALFLDGPKGRVAITLLRQSIDQCHHIKLIGLHNADAGTEWGLDFQAAFPSVQYCDRLAYAAVNEKPDESERGQIGRG